MMKKDVAVRVKRMSSPCKGMIREGSRGKGTWMTQVGFRSVQYVKLGTPRSREIGGLTVPYTALPF